MSNDKVVDKWRASKKATGKHLTTDGTNLWSYRLLIGYTKENGEKVALDYTASGKNFKSQTTSHHVSKAKSACDIIKFIEEKIEEGEWER